MKVRSVKLREAHTAAGNGRPSFCSILWDHQAHHLVTASSSETCISIHDPLLPSNTPKILRHHRDGVTALALSPNSTCLASGSVDHSVKLYKFPGGEFQTNITRFTLPLRCLAFNKSGSLLSAAGDDEGIKLINTVDGSIARVLKGHKGPVTGQAFDPNGEYLASIDSTGTVLYWELSSGRIIHTLRGVAPDSGTDLSLLNVISWSPDGETLAVPGLKNDVVMYDRDTAEKLFTLRGDHFQPVCFLAWSPNGKYMATSSLDRQVLIWDVDRKQDIDRQKFEEPISCMAWKPTGNALAVINGLGKYGIWDSVIPSSMKSPTEDIPNLKSMNSNGLLLFDEDEEDGSVSGNLSNLGEDSLDESEPPSRKRLCKQSEYEEDFDEDDNDGMKSYTKVEYRKKVKHNHKERLEDGDARSTLISSRPRVQEAFQSGSTPPQSGKRRFLCYNMLGSITTLEHDGYYHIEIDFHDTSRGPRIPAMTDHFGFTMAALNESGSVFANPCKGEKGMSTLMYRPFSSWASNSEWSMRFEGEEVKAVALGAAWVAAVTSFNFLRIFTEGGLQKNVVSLDGTVVTASGFKDELAVVTCASEGSSSNVQVLDFRVFNIPNGTQPLQGRLPLAPGSNLVWFGFTEEGQLSSYDSKGVLRVFTSQYGGSWLPVFSATANKGKADENYWVVGLNSTKLFCIICKNPELFPQVLPKPVLTLLDLSFPLASSDLGAESLENEFMMNNFHLFQIQKRMDEMAGAGYDTSSLDDEAFNVEAAQDRCILRLIASCCNGDKLVRATELVKLLSLEKSVKGAIKLVTALKLPNLAERFTSILEERMLQQSKESTNEPATVNNRPVSFTYNSRVTGAEILPPKETSESDTKSLSSPAFCAPLLIKKAKAQVSSNNGMYNPTQNQTAAAAEPGASKSNCTGEYKRDKEQINGVQKSNVQHSQPTNPFMKTSNKHDINKVEAANTVLHQRPSNPFLKSSIR